MRTAFLTWKTFEDYLRCLDCTRLTGQPQRYEQHGTAVQASVDVSPWAPGRRKPTPVLLCGPTPLA